LEAGQPHSRSAQALNNLSSTLSRRRELIARDDAPDLPLQVGVQTLLLQPTAAVTADIRRFSTLLDTCEQHAYRDITRCRRYAERLTAAVELSRADLRKGLTPDHSPVFDEWLTLPRSVVDERSAAALRNLAHNHQQRGAAATD
jgi:DNA-binding SARP family transcriptional activator